MFTQSLSPTLAETVHAARHVKARLTFRQWANRATAGAVALAVVLGAAMPARAGNDDLAKAVIAALVIGAIAHQAGKADAAPPPAQPVHGTRPWPPRPPAHPPHGGWKPPYHPPHHPPYYPPPRPAPQWRPNLPAVCAIDIDGRGGIRRVISESCLRRQGVSYRLPMHCAQEAKIWGRWDRVYATDCLRVNGFDIGGRR